MMETQETISQWAEETFGVPSSNYRVAARANEEMAKLLRAISTSDHISAAEGVADVAIVVNRLASLLRITLNLNLESLRKSHDIKKQFGERDLLLKISSMANLKLATVLTYLAIDDTCSPVGYMLHELYWFLSELAKEMGFDFQKLIDNKMTINRKLQRKLDGSCYHIREEE